MGLKSPVGLKPSMNRHLHALILGLLSDKSSLRNPAPPGRLTQIVISPTLCVFIFLGMKSAEACLVCLLPIMGILFVSSMRCWNITGPIVV